MSGKPALALIAAQASNRVIGNDNRMPWHLPEDLKYFRRVTMGKPVIMGRKTYESIGKPLPGRTNIVITRQSDWAADGAVTASSLAEAIDIAQREQPAEIMVIGGAQIYAEALPRADLIYLTRIEQVYDGDAYFPSLGNEWQETVVEQGVSEAGQLPFCFTVLRRVTKG